jgi:hypothetical protein
MFKTIMLIACILITATSTAEDYSFMGQAYDLKSNELLYTEYHHYISPTLHKVEYREPNGDIFATKTLNYEKSFFSPDVVFTNNRNGEFISAKKENKQVILEYQENINSSRKKYKISDNNTLVIDAGFDPFITSNWQSLISGESIVVNYLIPSQGDYYELNLEKTRCDNSENYCFSISASSFFIRMFSSELKLTYSRYNQKKSTNNLIKNSHEKSNYRLTSFTGRTNISDREGNYQDAHIRYQF